jgi:pyrroline-5-carboxylate reductase
MQKPFGFIGAGNMGEALMAGMIKSGLLFPQEILFSEPRLDQRERLQVKLGVKSVEDNPSLASRAPTLILAVKPQSVPEVLREMADQITPSHLLISIAAGVPLSYIQSYLTHPVRKIRVMPNTPALILQGAAALAPSSEATVDDLATARAIFDSVGKTVVVEEKLMDAVTGLSGSGPAYVFAFIEGLISGGVKEGLSRDVAFALAVQTVLGSAAMISSTAEHPAVLRDKVSSPGGTTMAGLYALEQGSFRASLMSAVSAATRRSRELGQALQTPPDHSSPPLSQGEKA